MSYAYAVTNLLASYNLATALTNDESDVANGAYGNDGRMDKRLTFSSSSSGENLYLDLGAAASIAGFALLNHNLVGALPSGPSISVKASNVGFGSLTTVKNITALYAGADARDPRRKDHVLQFPAVSRRYWALEITWPGSEAPSLAIGELFAYAAATQLSRGDIWGSGEREEQKNAIFGGYNGNTFGYRLGGPVRSKEMLLADWTKSQLAELQVLWRTTGGEATPFLWLNDYESTGTAATNDGQDCIYGRIADVDEFDWANDDYSIYQPPKVRVRSLGREIGS